MSNFILFPLMPSLKDFISPIFCQYNPTPLFSQKIILTYLLKVYKIQCETIGNERTKFFHHIKG